MPDEHVELFSAEVDRLARGEGYGDEREFLPGQIISYRIYGAGRMSVVRLKDASRGRPASSLLFEYQR